MEDCSEHINELLKEFCHFRLGIWISRIPPHLKAALVQSFISHLATVRDDCLLVGNDRLMHEVEDKLIDQFSLYAGSIGKDHTFPAEFQDLKFSDMP